MPAAGVVLFVPNSECTRVSAMVDTLNQSRVSNEVLRVFLVHPTRAHVASLVQTLHSHPDLQQVEKLNQLKPNAVLRDFTAPWRLSPKFAESHLILVGLETINAAFSKKYPIPNLTLAAGTLESGELFLDAAHRELCEEMRININKELICRNRPIILMSGGMTVYTYTINSKTHISFKDNLFHVYE